MHIPLTFAADSQAQAASNFRSAMPALRVFSGMDALLALPTELHRAGVHRALIVCGRSVKDKTDLIARIAEVGGERIVGIFGAMREGAPREDVEAAADQARELGADALIAVGAGSVTKACRVVAILLAEKGNLEALATRYDSHSRAHTTRLDAPKCPIFNVLTAATTSQARPGASIRDDALGHQLEFFDPKTRARAVFWDAQALLTAPPNLVRNAAGMEFWWSLMNLAGAEQENPLVMASRLHAWKLSQEALPRISDATDWQVRVDLCAASLLRVRDENDGGAPLGVPAGGGPMRMHAITRAVYMLAVGLFNSPARVNQAQATLALTPSAIRIFGHSCPNVVARLGNLLGAGSADPAVVAAAFRERMADSGFELGIASTSMTSASASAVVAYALRVFNCNADGAMNDKQDQLREVLASVLPQQL